MTAAEAPVAVLSRAGGYGRPAAPVRILHLGLGNFFRAHQAWYTDNATDAPEWGIAAFTGRSPALSDELQPSEGLYTLITRGPEGAAFEVISSVSAAHPASDHEAWLAYWRSPELAVVTLTVTEAGYLRAADGGLDTGRDDVQADLVALRADPGAPVATTPGRLVAGFMARNQAGQGPIAVVSCDNLPGNGAAVERVSTDFAALVSPELTEWIAANVSFVTTMVDRITPATTDADREEVYTATGVQDLAPVPTEPFSEWVIQGAFPAGRPAWDDAGALIVEDVVPFEHRKLWLLNGAHSLLAYAGSILGYETVADAISDPDCHAWVEQWWDEAATHLPLDPADINAYRMALHARFANPAIRHALAQIAADGSQKIPARIVPVIRYELAAGRVPEAAARVVGAWVAHLRGLGAPLKDARAEEVAAFGEGTVSDSVDAVVGFLGEDLLGSDTLRAAVIASVEDLSARSVT